MLLRYLVPLGALWLLGSTAAAYPVSAFDPPSAPGESTFLAEYEEEGMVFSTPSGLFHRDRGADSFFTDNGTAFLGFATVMEPLVISNRAGNTFALFDVDLAEYSLFLPAVDVPFVGYKADGSTVSTSFVLDGVQDGTGPGADFETFTFGSEFAELTHVEVTAAGYSLDNLGYQLTGIPEPSTWSMLLVFALVVSALAAKRVARTKRIL